MKQGEQMDMVLDYLKMMLISIVAVVSGVFLVVVALVSFVAIATGFLYLLIR